MTTWNPGKPNYVPAPADRFATFRRENVIVFEDNIGEAEREASREWERHVDAGRVGPHLSEDAK